MTQEQGNWCVCNHLSTIHAKNGRGCLREGCLCCKFRQDPKRPPTYVEPTVTRVPRFSFLNHNGKRIGRPPASRPVLGSKRASLFRKYGIQ